MVSVGMVVNAGNRSLRGCSATRPEAAGVGRTSPVHAKGLAKISGFGKSLDCQIGEIPGFGRYADPPSRRGFLFAGSCVAASRKWSRARSGFRAQRERGAVFSAVQSHLFAGSDTIRYCQGMPQREMATVNREEILDRIVLLLRQHNEGLRGTIHQEPYKGDFFELFAAAF